MKMVSAARDQQDWQINEVINDTGVKVDLELARLASSCVGTEKVALGEELAKLTGGAVTAPTQHLHVCL